MLGIHYISQLIITLKSKGIDIIISSFIIHKNFILKSLRLQGMLILFA